MKKYPYSCIHTKCNKKFETKLEKLRHHNETDLVCRSEKERLVTLLEKFKNTYMMIALENNGLEDEVTKNEILGLKRHCEQTLEELTDKELLAGVMNN
jgi:hypothetical protein